MLHRKQFKQPVALPGVSLQTLTPRRIVLPGLTCTLPGDGYQAPQPGQAGRLAKLFRQRDPQQVATNVADHLRRHEHSG